jgi:adenosylmethionine-8-amino-7-oxononanoate aminotransferase
MVCPPLIVEDGHLDEIISILNESLEALARKLGLNAQAVA